MENLTGLSGIHINCPKTSEKDSSLKSLITRFGCISNFYGFTVNILNEKCDAKKLH